MNCKKFMGAASAAVTIVIVIFTLMPCAWAQSKYKTLYKFNANGVHPMAGLIFDKAGNLYGTGGSNSSSGFVFMLAPSAKGAWTESVLYSFCSLSGCSDGIHPMAGLIFDKAGNLYGTTESGGANDAGTVFQLAPNANGGWTESVLYSFCSLSGCSDGGGPEAGLIFDQSGNLYGTTAGGGAKAGHGVVFQLTPNADGSWKQTVLHAFHGKDGALPVAGLIFDQAGNLYGTTESGGANDAGTVFKLMPKADGSWTESVLHSFCSRTNCDDGAAPVSALIFDQAGNLYGTTPYGGKLRNCGGTTCGVVFRLTPNADGSWKENVLHNFTDGKDGFYPYAGLIFDQSGNLYGTTAWGGNFNYCSTDGCGVVFKLAPNSQGGWTETVLHAFNGPAGAFPYTGVIFDQAGNLYGTTQGVINSSTFASVFEITP